MDQDLNISIFIISDLTVLLIVFNLKSGIVNLHSSQDTRNLVTGAVLLGWKTQGELAPKKRIGRHFG
jgi:hypothetical protein